MHDHKTSFKKIMIVQTFNVVQKNEPLPPSYKLPWAFLWSHQITENFICTNELSMTMKHFILVFEFNVIIQKKSS